MTTVYGSVKLSALWYIFCLRPFPSSLAASSLLYYYLATSHFSYQVFYTRPRPIPVLVLDKEVVNVAERGVCEEPQPR